MIDFLKYYETYPNITQNLIFNVYSSCPLKSYQFIELATEFGVSLLS